MIDDPIVLELGGETYELRATLAAMKKINDHFGSLIDCGQRLMRLDFSAIAFVIVAGADIDSKKQRARIEADLVGNLTQSLQALDRFIVLLTNGGVDQDEEDDQPGEA